jgi:hypothetical protein
VTDGTIHPDDVPHVVEVFTRSIAAGVPFEHENRLRRFDGKYRWFDVRGVPIRDDSGRIVRWYLLLTDIEDRTQALARLQQMESDFAHMNRVSMMGELAASLSHEITQPIASARNNARAAQNFLKMQPLDLDEVREALACVVGDADRAADIIDRIREQIKKAPPRKERFRAELVGRRRIRPHLLGGPHPQLPQQRCACSGWRNVRYRQHQPGCRSRQRPRELTKLFDIPKIARISGIRRESVYRAFGGSEVATLTTIVNVLSAMGFGLGGKAEATES